MCSCERLFCITYLTCFVCSGNEKNTHTHKNDSIGRANDNEKKELERHMQRLRLREYR